VLFLRPIVNPDAIGLSFSPELVHSPVFFAQSFMKFREASGFLPGISPKNSRQSVKFEDDCKNMRHTSGKITQHSG
jgi:hypothetical protein